MVSKKRPTDFSALTEGITTHRSPVDIAKSLTHHFTERHASPLVNITNPLDKEVDETWKLFSLADPDDSKDTIRLLKNKNSSGFDQV